MKNKKINYLILIIALFMAMSQLYVFSESNNISNNNIKNITVKPDQEKNIELDGQIGDWDPNNPDSPDFKQPNLDVDGNIPKEGEYYTISVTVPLNMEFYVVQHENLLEGNLFSPVYSIKNNGSKNISVKINSFYRKENAGIYDKNTVPLYVEKLNSKDDRTQIELKMCGIEDLDTSMRISKEIDLTEFKPGVNLEKELYTLSANQKKGVTFKAERWEFPKNVSDKGKAISNFSAIFVFSIV